MTPHQSGNRIREATPADADTVRSLVGEIAAHQNQPDQATTTVARWRELLSRDDVTVLLAERDGETLGFVSAVRRLHLWSGQDVLALDDWFYHRLGATLRNTIIATWPAAPQSDSLHLANVTAAEPEQGNHRDQDGCHLTPR